MGSLNRAIKLYREADKEKKCGCIRCEEKFDKRYMSRENEEICKYCEELDGNEYKD